MDRPEVTGPFGPCPEGEGRGGAITTITILSLIAYTDIFLTTVLGKGTTHIRAVSRSFMILVYWFGHPNFSEIPQNSMFPGAHLQ